MNRSYCERQLDACFLVGCDSQARRRIPTLLLCFRVFLICQFFLAVPAAAAASVDVSIYDHIYYFYYAY